MSSCSSTPSTLHLSVQLKSLLSLKGLTSSGPLTPKSSRLQLIRTFLTWHGPICHAKRVDLDNWTFHSCLTKIPKFPGHMVFTANQMELLFVASSLLMTRAFCVRSPLTTYLLVDLSTRFFDWSKHSSSLISTAKCVQPTGNQEVTPSSPTPRTRKNFSLNSNWSLRVTITACGKCVPENVPFHKVSPQITPPIFSANSAFSNKFPLRSIQF